MPVNVTVNVTHEVRFAVVMYGGVSLAIYINGVAQELLRLVRATAPATSGSPGARPLPPTSTPGTERVYRKLSYLIADPDLLARCRSLVAAGVAAGREPAVALAETELETQLEEGGQITTRFIVDILSGTSAGGINAIHLSKALANEQDIRQLKDLWINEGDVALLLNDRSSVHGLRLSEQVPPQSLLNSRRMYLSLLKSLDDMEDSQPPDPAQPAGSPDSALVDELDLFITATDIEGVPLPLKLSDDIVYERRHRNVFHFKYASREASGAERQRNDFVADNNPFLAFAARCTSAFPFAFEPMRLCDIDEVLNGYRRGHPRQHCSSDDARWQAFFKLPLEPRTGSSSLPFSTRSFGDGGYLDNKPFSYATETLTRRQAPVPVDRKLIYIEPSPEHPEEARSREEKYSSLENIMAALFELPRYETIREDLQRVLDRNRLIQRVSRLLSQVETDVDRSPKSERITSDHRKWQDVDIADLVELYGVYYLPYLRLRVETVTDGVAGLVTRLAGFDDSSDYSYAIRCLLQAWRTSRYADYHTPGKPTTVRFLDNFDYDYRVRRLHFLRRRIDQMYEAVRHVPEASVRRATLRRPRTGCDDEAPDNLAARLKGAGLDVARLTAPERVAAEESLLVLKWEVERIFRDLRRAGREINHPGGAAGSQGETVEPGLLDAINSLHIESGHLRYVLGEPLSARATSDSGAATPPAPPDAAHDRNDASAISRGCEMLEDPSRFELPADLRSRLDAAADLLGARLDQAFSAASHRIKELLSGLSPLSSVVSNEAGAGPAPANISPRARLQRLDGAEAGVVPPIRLVLWESYIEFEHYDQITFPIVYDTDVGESDIVDIIRISPEDARSLIDERRELATKPYGRARRKLAGTTLHNFGAFLDRVWRKNDVLWGRLDGAERLVTALLPGSENELVRAALVDEAHTAILREEMTLESREELQRVVADALLRASTADPPTHAIQEVLRRLGEESPIPTRLRSIIQSSLADREFLRFMHSTYEVNRQLDPKPLLRVISRSTQIIGRMFEEMAERQGLEGKRLAWIARLGQVFWGLVEVAVPNSMLNLMTRYWFKILLAFEVFLIVGAWLLNAEETLSFGFTSFLITIGVGLVVVILRDWMRLKRGWLRLTFAILVLAVTSLALIGADEVFSLGIRVGLCDGVATHSRGWKPGVCVDEPAPGLARTAMP